MPAMIEDGAGALIGSEKDDDFEFFHEIEQIQK